MDEGQREQRRLAHQHAVMAEIGRIIGSSLNIDEVYERFAQEVRKLIPMDRITINVIDEENDVFRIVYATGLQVPGAETGAALPLQGSPTARVGASRSGLLLNLDDIVKSGGAPPAVAMFKAGIRTVLRVPLATRGAAFGTLAICSTQSDLYDDRHLVLAERVGSQIAGAIASSQLYRQLEKESKERDVLAEIGRIVSSSVDIVVVYQQFADRVAELIPFDRVSLWTVDAESGVVGNSSFAGVEIRGWGEGVNVPIAGTLAEEVIYSGRSKLLGEESLRSDAQRFPGIGAALAVGLRSAMQIPVISADEVVAVLIFRSLLAEAYTESDVHLAERVAAQIAGAVANARLYAELQEAEEALREGERHYRSLYDHTPVMMHAIDGEGRLIDVNRGWLDTLGYERSEVIGRRSTDFLTDASRRYAIEVALPEFWRTGSAADIEYQMVKKNGEVIDVLLSAVAERDEAGVANQSLAFTVDVTERKRADEAIAYQAHLVENVNDAIIASDERFVATAWNRAAEEMYGWTAEEVIGRPTAELLRPEFVDVEPDEVLRRLREEGHFDGEVIRPRKDGIRIHTEARAMALRDKDGSITGFVSIDRDITERKQLEERFLQAQKMEAFGQLAGGVAHDFNNLLTAIINFTYLATKGVSEEGAVSDYLSEVQSAAERASGLTSQLLAFSRRQVIEPTVLNPNEIIMETDKMLRRLIGEDIELVTLGDPELGLVKVDPGQIEQVLTNLAVNARDAMPEGGKLVIETANVSLDEEFARWHPEITAGEYILLSVSDTGVGMTEEVQTHAFEPFFTTKEVGKGTGLGLSTCYGIVAQSGGHIEIQSEPGQGTTIRMYLPRVEEIRSTLPVPDESGYLPAGSETVLLVEDEPLVRHATAEILRAQGYDVLEAANGTEAMQVAAEHAGEPIHLLLTDVVMPLMGGSQLAQQVTKVHLETRVLYMSGYVDDTMVRQQLLQNHSAFLQKPFTAQMLARRVRETLDRDLAAV